MIADMWVRYEAAFLLTWRAAKMKDAKLNYSREAAMAKLDLEMSDKKSMNLTQWVEDISNWKDYHPIIEDEFFAQVEELANQLEKQGY
jgi:hypothetical protein